VFVVMMLSSERLVENAGCHAAAVRVQCPTSIRILAEIKARVKQNTGK
jgi:hypothetical protein